MTYLIGDIGNTETKLCVLDKKFKIIKRLNVDTLKIKNQYYFKKIIFSFVKNKIIDNKALFSSVVPSVFFAIKKYFKKYFNIQCQELKQTYYSKIIKIKKEIMPFKSEKQRRYLWKNEPKIAREWTKAYGSKPKGKKKKTKRRKK